jgi:hypothetical protein
MNGKVKIENLYISSNLFQFLFSHSIVLLNSAASEVQITPSQKDDYIKKGISGEWVKIVQTPSEYFNKGHKRT